MRNKYAELFSKFSPEEWKTLCDKYLTRKQLGKALGNVPSNIICYYEKKFNYKCPLNSQIKDERGNIYGQLTVKSYAGINKKGEALWLCVCSCGRQDIRSGSILRYAVKNHNCMCKECAKQNVSNLHLKDLTGQIINYLRVDKRVGAVEGSGLATYQCTCLNCGNILTVSSGVLSNHKQISCGCINSAGEYKIAKILQELNIDYIQQYKFKDCKNVIPLRFDFALFKNQELQCLIEFQGEQHFSKDKFKKFTMTDEQFALVQKRDQIKKDYCAQHNIPLIEIPYQDRKKLSIDYMKNLLQLFDLI